MKIEKSDIVISINGRDAGKSFFVVGTEEDYSMLADGKGRRLEKPKRKKNKHLRFAAKSDSRAAERLRSGEKVTNNEIRRALAEYEAGAARKSRARKDAAGCAEKEGGMYIG